MSDPSIYTKDLAAAAGQVDDARRRDTAGRTEELHQAFDEPLVLLDLAFPRNKDAPAVRRQLPLVAPVALHVALELAAPIVVAGFRQPAFGAAGVPVPEAAVYENHHPALAKHQVRAPGQAAPMQAEAVALGVQGAAHDEFRLGVNAANAAHQSAAFLRRERVHAAATLSETPQP